MKFYKELAMAKKYKFGMSRAHPPPQARTA
jgi:hypothetical protein